MRKGPTKETIEKARKTREENERKIGEFLGYELWIDSRNFITIDKNGIQHYYSSLYQLFYGINLEVNQKKIKEVTLDNITKKLLEGESKFLSDLKEVLGTLTFMDPDKCINEKK